FATRPPAPQRRTAWETRHSARRSSRRGPDAKFRSSSRERARPQSLQPCQPCVPPFGRAVVPRRLSPSADAVPVSARAVARGRELNYHWRRLPPRGPICNAARTWRTSIATPSASRAPSLRPLALPSARRLTHALWYGRSVRAQLLIAFILIYLIPGAGAGAGALLRARRSPRVEIAASMELAQLLVSEAVALMQQAVPAEKFLADLASPLRLVRHVRIVVKDATGAPLAVRPPRAAEATRE